MTIVNVDEEMFRYSDATRAARQVNKRDVEGENTPSRARVKSGKGWQNHHQPFDDELIMSAIPIQCFGCILFVSEAFKIL